MGLETHDGQTANNSTKADVQSALLEGTWNKPQPTATTTDSSSANAYETSKATDVIGTPTFVNGDGSTLSGRDLLQQAVLRTNQSETAPVEVAAMTLGGLRDFGGDNEAEIMQVADRRSSNRGGGTADALMSAARNSVGKTELGNRVPDGAAQFPGMKVEQNVQCASTSSDWLMQAGFMRERDYNVSVTGLSKWLGEHGFKKVPLSGDFDISKFPDGPIGFIAGTRNVSDGSNHIGFIEKRNGEVRVIHNNWRTGAVVDQNINEKFYDANGKPQYKNMSLYILPRR